MKAQSPGMRERVKVQPAGLSPNFHESQVDSSLCAKRLNRPRRALSVGRSGIPTSRSLGKVDSATLVVQNKLLATNLDLVSWILIP